MSKPASVNLFESQFFFDDTWIEESIRVQRVWHRPEKRVEPVLRGDMPWEQDMAIGYGTVLFWRGCFRMWYVTWPFTSPRQMYVCYAESDDGVCWRKPSLGLVSYNGNRDNNIAMALKSGFVDCLGVIDDPDDDEWPLKMIYWRGLTGKPIGLSAARSRDGIRWNNTPGLVLGKQWGDRTTVMSRKDNGKYVIFGRYLPHLKRWRSRVVDRVESRDLIHWSRPELIFKQDCEDDPLFEIYSVAPFRWGSLYLGYMERMHYTPDVLDTELCFSHDGRAWQRSRARQAFLERGPESHFDCGWVNATCNPPICRNNEMLIHYSGRAHGHAAHAGRALRYGAIGVASMRIDGFCSLRALEMRENVGPAAGWVLTKPMRWPKAELSVNFDPRRDVRMFSGCGGGEVRVELRDTGNQPIPGFTFESCLPLEYNPYRSVHGDATEQARWKGNKRMATLAGRTLRLAFRLHNAHLYAFKARREDVR